MSKSSAALLFTLVMMSATLNLRASTITAASCGASDVQAALDQARAGDTVRIPAGTCSWTSRVEWSAPANVTVLGAGSLNTVGGGDATVIIDNYGSGQPLLTINTSATGSFRLAGLTIQGGTGALKETAVLYITGSSRQLRIDHIRIDMQAYSPQRSSKPIRFTGALNGVLDSSIIDLAGIGWVHFQGSGEGDAAWAEDAGFGSGNFVFLEDNQFNSTSYLGTVSDCNAGGRFVIRYNTVVGANVGQTHPTGGSGRGRGCRAHELYGNTVTPRPGFNSAQEPNFTFSWMSSGALLLWGNSASGVYKNFLTVSVMRKNNNTYSQSATPNGWGYCGTAFNGTASPWDGNTNTSSGYPCLDQPGRGKGDLLSGNFPAAVNTRTGMISWPQQQREPIYEWLNTASIVSGWGGSYVNNDSSTRIVPNQEYYLRTTSFTGANGMGVGPISDRPATCTTGVAYWATDQGEWNSTNGATPDGKMYVCTTTNTWTARYGDPSNSTGLPYPYPHPLRGGATATPPAPATSVRITS